jgi:hypothetical protein
VSVFIASFISHSDDLSTVKENKGQPPAPFRHSWREAFEAEKARMKAMVVRTGDPSAHYEDGKNKVSINFLQFTILFVTDAFSKAHYRDHYQCVFTGQYDSDASLSIPEVGQEVRNSLALTTTVECAHIFPRLNNAISCVSNKDAKVQYINLSSPIHSC